MDFQPKSEQEILEEMLIPDGVYDFEVIKAEEKQSKSGKDMIALTLSVFLPNGNPRTVRDWLVGSDAPLCLMKIRHFSRSCKLMAAYESGTLNQYVCHGATGKVKIGFQDQDNYGPQNTVVDYVCEGAESEQRQPMGVPATQTKAANEAFAESGAADDDCPF